MTWYVLLLVLAQVTAPQGMWPTTVAGWVSLFVSITGAVGFMLATARAITVLNGFGQRLGKVEDNLRVIEQARADERVIVQGVLTAQEQLLKAIGAAQASAAQCQTDTQRMGDTLAHKIDDVAERVTKRIEGAGERWAASERRLSMALHGLETELRARGILASQPPAPPPMPLPPSGRSD